MLRKTAIALALASATLTSVPAYAGSGWWWGGSSGSCKKYCGGSTTSSSTTSSSSTSGGHQVPEPGMLAMFGLGLVGIAIAQRRRSRGE